MYVCMYVCMYIYVYICVCVFIIMKTMCRAGYHHNGFMATHALGHKAIVVITGRAHCFHDSIYITLSCFFEIWALCVSWITFSFLFLFFPFFLLWVFFHNFSRITGLQGKGESISLTYHYYFHPLARHLDISRAITAESSPLHISAHG